MEVAHYGGICHCATMFSLSSAGKASHVVCNREMVKLTNAHVHWCVIRDLRRIRADTLRLRGIEVYQ